VTGRNVTYYGIPGIVERAVNCHLRGERKLCRGTVARRVFASARRRMILTSDTGKRVITLLPGRVAAAGDE